MIGAGETGALAACLGGQLGATVGADIVEGAQLTVRGAGDQDRGTGEIELTHDEGAGFGQFAFVADVEPGALEDRLFLQLEVLVLVIGASRHRTGAERKCLFGLG